MPGFGWLVLFLVPFIGVSFFTAVYAMRALEAGDGRTGGVLAAVAITFALVSLIVLARGFSERPRAVRVPALRPAHPAEPWMWREDWAAGRSVSEPRTSAVSMLVFAILCSLLTAALLFFAPEQLTRAGKRMHLDVILAVISVALLVAAGRQLVRSRKFGPSVLMLTTVPAPLGGRLQGTIETALPRGAVDAVVRLACIRVTTSTSGENRTTTEHMLWQDEQAATGPFEPRPASRVAIPVRFELPADARPTQRVSGDEEIMWRLEATAALPGVDYAARFDVPVFAVAGAAAPAPSPSAFTPAAGLPPSRPSVRVAPTASGGTAFWFGPARNGAAALAFTGFAAIFGGALWIQLRLGVPVFPFITGAVLSAAPAHHRAPVDGHHARPRREGHGDHHEVAAGRAMDAARIMRRDHGREARHRDEHRQPRVVRPQADARGRTGAQRRQCNRQQAGSGMARGGAEARAARRALKDAA